MFFDRAEAGRRLARALARRTLVHPLVIAIPRGGAVTGAALAREIRAELDVILCHKLRPASSEGNTIGVLAEGGKAYLDDRAIEAAGISRDELKRELQLEAGQIEQESQVVRAVRPRAAIQGRSVIVTDDGIASGAGMMAVLETIRSENPAELIVAVPVAPADRFDRVARLADDAVCLHRPGGFSPVGRFYRHFPSVEDEEVLAILKEFASNNHGRSTSPIGR